MCENLTMTQIGRYLLDGGFPRQLNQLATMIAISWCESGGYTCARNPNCPNAVCYGLFQMNEGYGTSLYDPATAARHAADVYRASTWQYWGCGPWHQKGYLPNYPAALVAATAVLAGKGGMAKLNIPCVGGTCPQGYTVNHIPQRGGVPKCVCVSTGDNIVSNTIDKLGSLGSFFGNITAYLKVAGGGVVLMAGLAVLVVGATGAKPAAIPNVVYRLPPVRRAVGRRAAVRERRTTVERRAAGDEAAVRVIRRNEGTTKEKVIIQRRRKSIKQASTDEQAYSEDQAEKAVKKKAKSKEFFKSGPKSKATKERVSA